MYKQVLSHGYFMIKHYIAGVHLCLFRLTAVYKFGFCVCKFVIYKYNTYWRNDLTSLRFLNKVVCNTLFKPTPL